MGPKNSGLFTRRTIREVLNGWEDPLISVANGLTLPPGVSVPAAYTGLLGPYRNETSTIQDLEDAIAAGAVPGTDYETEFFSGKDDVANNHKFVSFEGFTVQDRSNVEYWGWGNDGAPGATLKLGGLRKQTMQSPRKDPLSSWAMYTGGFEAKPDFGAGVHLFFAPGRRPVTIGCKSDGTWGDNNTDNCAFHDVKGIKTLKYSAPSHLFTTKVDGLSSTSCRGTASAQYVDSMAALGLPTTEIKSTCDFIQRGNGLVNLEKVGKQGSLMPVALTQGYMHQVDKAVRDAVSITDPMGTTNIDTSKNEIYFVAGEDELSLYIDPITGLTLEGRENTQLNFMIEAKMLNSDRYANLFSAVSDNGDSFVWPYVYFKRTMSLEDDDADEYKRHIYGGYTTGFALIITGIIMMCLCTILGIVLCVMAKKDAKRTELKSKAGGGKVAATFVSVTVTGTSPPSKSAASK